MGWIKTVLLPKFEPADYLRSAEVERATHHFLVPHQISRLLRCDEFDRTDLSSSKVKYFGGADTPLALKKELCARWPGANLEAYGMSEGAPATGMFHERFPNKPNSVGLPMGSVEIKIIAADDREVSDGSVGEIVGRSGMMMSGYHGRPDLTQALIWRDGAGREFFDRAISVSRTSKDSSTSKDEKRT